MAKIQLTTRLRQLKFEIRRALESGSKQLVVFQSRFPGFPGSFGTARESRLDFQAKRLPLCVVAAVLVPPFSNLFGQPGSIPGKALIVLLIVCRQLIGVSILPIDILQLQTASLFGKTMGLGLYKRTSFVFSHPKKNARAQLGKRAV